MKTYKKNLERVTVEHLGIFFEVEGVYYKGLPQTRENPEEPDEFSVHDVYVNGVKITDIIKEEILDELDNLACEEIKNN